MKNDSSRFGHIIQLFTVLLTAILISLFFGVLVLVGKIQGTARVVNYAGLVRGKTQRIVKLEISGTPEDDLLGDVASYIEGLRFGSSELDLVRLDDADFQAKMTALSSEFDDLRNELILVRQRGYTETAIIAKSEHFFQTCDEATNLAEVYSQKRATALDFLEKVVLADIVGLLLLFGYQIFKALRYAAMNRILQRKVYLDEATGLHNKNKCEELLDAPDPPDGNTALCVFDLNNLRTINNNLGHDKGDEYIRSFAEQLRLAVPSQHFVGRDGGETVLTAPETRAAFDEAQQFTQIVSKNALDFAAIQQAAGLSENSMQTFYHDWTVYNEYEALTANTAASAEVVPASSFTHSEGSPISINFAPVYNFSGVSDTQQFESLLTSHDDDMREYILGVVEEAEHDKFRRAYA